MLHLDYISCLLTVVSTVLVGRRLWHGWVIAGANSVVICVIALKASQPGFILSNLFCIALYGYNLLKWRMDTRESTKLASCASCQHDEPCRRCDRVPRRSVRRERFAPDSVRREPFTAY